jgi:hypothetical protein
LYVVFRFWNELCSPPPILLWSLFFTVLDYWALVSFSPSFSGARIVIRQLTPWCQHIVMICWLFFNFAVPFDFGYWSLAQEMSFVDHYLLYFRQ